MIDIYAEKFRNKRNPDKEIIEVIKRKLKDICNGEKTQAEILGFDEIAIWRVRGTFPFSLE